MRSHIVVVLPPLLDHHLRFDPIPEPLDAQAFVPELAVEAFIYYKPSLTKMFPMGYI